MRNKNEKRATPKLSDGYSLAGDVARRKRREADESAAAANEAKAIENALEVLNSGGMVTVDLSDKERLRPYLKAVATDRDRFYAKRGKERYVFGSKQVQEAA